MDFRNFVWGKLTNFDHLLNKPSLGTWELPHKILARSVQPLWVLTIIGYRRTDKPTNRKTKYKNIILEEKTFKINDCLQEQKYKYYTIYLQGYSQEQNINIIQYIYKDIHKECDWKNNFKDMTILRVKLSLQPSIQFVQSSQKYHF